MMTDDAEHAAERCMQRAESIMARREWWSALPDEERQRRERFSRAFATDLTAFRALPLSHARHISVHRKGHPPVDVAFVGRFGVSYKGGPTERVPTTETRHLPEGYEWMERPIPLKPMWTDFYIDGRSLFPECDAYLEKATESVKSARALSAQIHGTSPLTPPTPK